MKVESKRQIGGLAGKVEGRNEGRKEERKRKGNAPLTQTARGKEARRRERLNTEVTEGPQRERRFRSKNGSWRSKRKDSAEARERERPALWCVVGRLLERFHK